MFIIYDYVNPESRRRELALARNATDTILSLVQEDSLYDRPIDRRHRLIFYLGHVDAFDWNHIARFGLSETSFAPTFDRLFEAGIDPDSSNLPQDTRSDWPSVQETRKYVQALRQRIDTIIDAAPDELVQMAIEHRLMHAETLAYAVHQMPPDVKRAPEGSRRPTLPRTVANSIIAIPAGQATLGRNRESFGWDNEFDSHTVDVPEFAVQRFKVTNGAYLEFVREGGEVPPFWERTGAGWSYRGMFGLEDLPLDQPVYVTWEQAMAYARSKGMSLPTESQFHRAAYGTAEGAERSYPWGDGGPSPERGNFDFISWDPVAVDSHPSSESAFGVAQMVGNGWEWTSTPFGPFPGFHPAPNYPGYSANFFDGAHYVIKGGSPRTAARLLRRSFRNWFRLDYPYVYATFRCVRI